MPRTGFLLWMQVPLPYVVSFALDGGDGGNGNDGDSCNDYGGGDARSCHYNCSYNEIGKMMEVNISLAISQC